jgi:hypothetical protein
MKLRLVPLRYFRHLPSAIVVASLVLSPLVQAAPPPPPDGSDGPTPTININAQNMPIDADASADLDAIDTEAQAKSEQTKQWADSQETILPLLLEAAVKLDEKANRLEQERGPKVVEQMIAKDQFMVDLADGGTAEYRLIDGQRVPRIVVGDASYILVDEKLISRDSPHLLQYIARAHIESGLGRVALDANGQPMKNMFGFPKRIGGRDLTVAFFNDDVNNPEMVSMPKPHFTQWSWWKEYYLSKKKTPGKNDFSLALATGFGLQVGLTYGMTMVKAHELSLHLNWAPAIFTGLFGLTIGTFTSFYKNLTNKSISNFTRTLKRLFVSSLPYAYGVIIALAPGDMHHRLATISLFTAAGLSKNLSIWVNGIFNNIASSYWNGPISLREKSRDGNMRIAGGISFQVGEAKKTWEIFNWSRSNAEYNLYYIIPWLFNQVSLVALAAATWSKIPGTEISLPIVPFAGIPIAMYWTKWYARRLANRAQLDPDMTVRARELDELATGYEKAWSNLWDFKSIPGKIIDTIKSIGSGFATAGKSLFSRCADLLGR